MKKIKYGIIGAGTMAREHILNISLIDNAEVVALADPHEDSLNQCKEILKTKVFCFKNHLEMIEKNIVDVYLISSPNFTHIEILKDVIKTKKHILVEKPMAKTVEEVDEIKKISEIAHNHKLNMHMDGARFANALVSLNCSPAEMTWKSGVDVLSFGATKNGCLAAEAIIFFKPELVGNLAFLMKRAGHLLSKMSFVSAQLDAYITNEVWLRNAKHANAMGKKLSQGLDQHKNIELTYPTDANEIFVKIPKDIIDQLNSEGYTINDDEWDGNAVRLVTAWNTEPSDVENFLNYIQC